jgi:hypothetical protein
VSIAGGAALGGDSRVMILDDITEMRDEIAVERSDITEEQIREIMSEQPKWAEELQLPISVEAWVGRRYRK